MELPWRLLQWNRILSCNSDVLPDLTWPVLAVIIICAVFGYGFTTRNRIAKTIGNQNPIDTKPREETE